MRCLLTICFALFVFADFVGAPIGSIFHEPAEWERLDSFQETISREEFMHAMDRVYSPNVDWSRWMTVGEGGVWVDKGEGLDRYYLKFSNGGEVVPKRRFDGVRGMRIALDPGHIGGDWGPMEHRSFSAEGGAVLQEGDLTLATAIRLAKALEELGAEVFLTREEAEPVTKLRAEDLEDEAGLWLSDSEAGDRMAKQAAVARRLFYRSAEIRARARRIEEWGGADIAIVLHINASAAPDSERQRLHDRNDAHVIVNGCYLAEELADPTQRLQLLLRLVKGYQGEEVKLGAAMVEAIHDATGLPPYRYEGENAVPLDEEGYLWARNLLANRSYDCPVVYLEPWQANGEAVYEWAAAGDYDGERQFAGELRQSLPAVYAEMVLRGLEARYD
ncbi:N-acetylmuramoyl-L-alanine amidase domain protein [Verrucomicrobiia bacterium DG1235]|nr:N-acetylmuramoyl-L-alanine amidase domain protein [Verrucomicrobiae bacterium DG1235]